MGLLDHLSNVCSITSTRKSKIKPMQTVELRVKMDCQGCENKVRNTMNSMKGVQLVDVDRKHHKVTVSGHVEPNKVLNRVKRTGKHAEFWPYVEYQLAYYPYHSKAYDKKAPPGHVRNVPQAFPSPNGSDEKYSVLFSDENVDSCSIM